MEQNTLSPENNNQQNSKQTKTKYIIIAIVVVAIVSILTYIVFGYKKETLAIEKTEKKYSIIQKKDSLLGLAVKQDSIQFKNEDARYYDEEEAFGNYVYIGNQIVLGERLLNSGDRVYVDYKRSNDSKKIIYLDNPYQHRKLPFYTVNANNLIDEYQYERYAKNFSIPPYSNLANNVKDIILDNSYSNSNNYNITQNAERVKSTICFGDFDGDGTKDAAVLLDNNEKQISRLLIICTNSVNKKPYIGFAENYNDKMKINSFKKGAQIIKNYDLEPSDIDGVILKGENVKIAVVYDKNLQKFKTFYQE